MGNVGWRSLVAQSARSPFILHPSSLTLCFALFVAGATPAMAQALVDPTQPPMALAPQAPAVEGVASPVQQLQSVIISPTRKAAIINGVVVELGGKYGDAVLTKVGEDEVVLSGDGSRQVLKLYPAVEKVGVSKNAPRKTPPKANPQRKPSPSAEGKQP